MTTLATPIDTANCHDPLEGAARARLVTVARDEARFCLRLDEVVEVGRIVHLTRVTGPHDAIIGSMVLHSQTVWVVDAAAAIGAIHQASRDPTMFAATRTQPSVCIAFDGIIGKHTSERITTDRQPHGLIDGLVAVSGMSIPVVNVRAVASLCDCTGRILKATSLTVETEKEHAS